MKIDAYTFETYMERVREFHGYDAPGLAIGWFMIKVAYEHLPEEGLFDALCETPKCLPDAIQLLTPCTIGNGWLTIKNLGRYALTLYDKYKGNGIRVAIDPEKLEPWPEIKAWFFKLKEKETQNEELLIEEIKKAGTSICKIQHVRVKPEIMVKKHRDRFAVCPMCHESYPLADGPLCLGCQNPGLYEE
ncbi:MAG: formylmethanofuran dehydrogenase subunit E family protein [Syntrophorhabdaceae bacterium]|nr:formylmethanofuran dehydrogenase subunit E family protein [Syntrophorhabdaceae bacterium]